MKAQSNLFSSFQLNELFTLKNRIVMAPMTRVQAAEGFVPTSAMAAYYERRADAGLIVTEGTVITPTGRGHNHVPGLFTTAQVHGWRRVTDAVHARGGLIFAQIWHVGRVSHPSLLNGALPISASDTAMSQRIPRMDNLHYGQARAATQLEIQELIQLYGEAASNAITAGFDGVEIHGANGYLIDQFLHYDTNKRTDDYGGSVERMAQFALEVVRACGEAIGYERVGIRLSPAAYLNEIALDLRDADVFAYLFQQLNALPIAYVHTGNFNDAISYVELHNMTMSSFIRQHYLGVVIGCGSYTPDTASAAIQRGQFDLVAMGRPFIANPDLVAILSRNAALRPYDVSMLQDLY